MTLTSASTYASSASESLQSRNVQQGLKYMEKAAARNPLNAVYHTGLMQIYLGSSRIDQSLEEAKQAAVLSRYSAARKADLASVSLYAGKYEEAVNHAREAIELAPFQISWYENLAGICAAAGQGELIGGNKDTARKDLEEAIGVPLLIQKKVGTLNEEEKKLWRDGPMMSSTPKVLLYTGQSHYLLGNLTEADKDLQSVLSDQQSKGEALVWLALVKEKQGKGQEAAQLIKQASDINKDYEKTYEQLKRLPVL
jgi:tetratricopeptide (TPR) repeat protein